MDNLFEIIGIIGSIIVLFAFFLNQTNRATNQSFLYDFLNFLGSFALVCYGIYNGVIPFVILNIVWLIVSLVDVVKFLLKKR